MKKEKKGLFIRAEYFCYPDGQKDTLVIFDRSIVSEMMLGEVIVRSILNMPKYDLSLFTC